MEQTQPIPYINTSVAFYKRQLWLYNLGIHTLHDGKGTMCLWTESEGKRGANEVASSLISFLENKEGYENLVSFSDCCSGQNRNKIIVSLFFHICQATPIKSWTHNFLESGHSFLPNDTDFGKIEKKKKDQLGIYCYNDFKTLIKRCKFDVNDMKSKFYDISQLTKKFNFRNVDEDKEKFSWLKLKKIQVSADNFIMRYKYSCIDSEPWKTIDFSRNYTLSDDEILSLHESGIKIKKEKYLDILSLLKFVPSVHHDFFLKLKHDGQDEYDESEILPE